MADLGSRDLSGQQQSVSLRCLGELDRTVPVVPDDPSKGLHVPNTGAATTTHSLQPSALTLTYHPGSLLKGLPGAPDTNCNAASAPPPPNTIPPNNSNPLTICEEVREGGAAEDYVAGSRFWNRSNQAEAAADSFDIRFPRLPSRSRPIGSRYQRSATTTSTATISAKAASSMSRPSMGIVLRWRGCI